MDIEIIGTGRVLIKVDDEELRQYGVDFRDMSLHDEPTRTMLHRMLALIGDMGMRRDGDHVAIDCAEGSDGGVMLLFVIGRDTLPYRCRFDCADDVIAAASAGALPRDIRSVHPDGAGYIITCGGDIPDEELLLEFCEVVE